MRDGIRYPMAYPPPPVRCLLVAGIYYLLVGSYFNLGSQWGAYGICPAGDYAHRLEKQWHVRDPQSHSRRIDYSNPRYNEGPVWQMPEKVQKAVRHGVWEVQLAGQADNVSPPSSGSGTSSGSRNRLLGHLQQLRRDKWWLRHSCREGQTSLPNHASEEEREVHQNQRQCTYSGSIANQFGIAPAYRSHYLGRDVGEIYNPLHPSVAPKEWSSVKKAFSLIFVLEFGGRAGELPDGESDLRDGDLEKITVDRNGRKEKLLKLYITLLLL